MKTIAVLTDFSEEADNAAIYALHLAQHLHANIIIYNSFLVPSAEPTAAMVAWPMEDYNELQNDSEQQLESLSAKLKTEQSASKYNGFQPSITCKSHYGHLQTYMDELLENKDIVLLVMGNHKKGISAFILGNHLRDIMDNVSVPILIIPKYHVFKNINEIALASDLHDGDVHVIHSLAGFARAFNAQILVAHTSDEKFEDSKHQRKIDSFLNDITCKVNYPKIYYRNIKSATVSSGLQWLMENGQVDVLTMVHRHKSFFEQLFGNSNTKKMLSQIDVPLLVYPYPFQSLPVF